MGSGTQNIHLLITDLIQVTDLSASQAVLTGTVTGPTFEGGDFLGDDFRADLGFMSKELSSVVTPPSSYQRIYPKSTDHRWYTRTSAGVETIIPLPGAESDYYYLTLRTASGLANSFSLGSLTTGIPLMTVSGGNATLSSLGLVTTIGAVGYDTNIGTEKAVRDSISSATVPINMDAYSSANQDSFAYLQAINYKGFGQSFTGNGYPLNKVKWYLKKGGTVTGTAHAKLYEHAGTYGTSSVPTGAALSTSDGYNVNDLTTDYQLIEFIFSSPYATVNGTYYVVSIEYIGSDPYLVSVGIDHSAPTHPGNFCSLSAADEWAAVSADDAIFYAISHVYGGGGATITWGGILGDPADQSDLWVLLGSKPTAALVTTLADPGLDTNVASEKAVRDAIDAIGGGTMVYPGAGIGVSTGSAWGTSLADPLTAVHGGTGKASWTQYAIPYAPTTTTIGEINPAQAGYLYYNGAGGYSFASGTGSTTPGGSNTYVQFNYLGAFGGSSNLTWDYTNNILKLRDVPSSYTPYGSGALTPLALSIGIGSVSTPSSSTAPVVRLEKWSSASAETWDAGVLHATLFKESGSSYAAAITGHAQYDGGTGDVIGIHGRVVNNMSGATRSAYAGWFVAVQNYINGQATHGIEIDVANTAGDAGHMTAPGPGLLNGLWVYPSAGGSYHGTWGIGVGGHSATQKWHTGLFFGADSIVPTTGTTNEGILLRGGSTAPNAYTGIRMSGYLTSGLDLTYATTTYPILLPNAEGIYSANSTYTGYVHLMYLNSSNQLAIGTGLANGALYMQIDGIMRQLTIDGNGFVKAN